MKELHHMGQVLKKGSRFTEDSLQKICLSRPYHLKFFKGCLPQTSLGPFLFQMLMNFRL